MKKTYKLINYILPVLLLAFAITSCKKDDAYLGFTPGTGAPTITSVHTISKSVVDSSLTTSTTTYNSSGVATTTTGSNYNPQVVAFDSTTTTGKGGTQYDIIGTNLGSATTVTFNGIAAFFDRALGSNTHLIVTIPTTAPFGPNQAGTLVVTTQHGTANFKFTILQPPPVIASIGPLAGAAGDTLTITGTVLDNTTSVTFGTVPATVVANTSTQLKVLIPAGIVQAYIIVTTPGGTAKSTQSFGFKYLIYLNGLTKYWGGNGGGYTGYSGTTFNFANTLNPGIGTTSIATTFGGQYSAAQIGYDNNPYSSNSPAPTVSVSTLGLTSIEFSIYGGANSQTGDQLQLVVNGNYGNAVVIKITAGAYTTFTIPLSSLGSPTTIYEFVLQTFQSSSETIYFDYIGFI